jgi:ABC-type sugar transport system permease subunit
MILWLRRNLLFISLLSPALLIILAVIGYPMARAIYSSLFEFSFARPYLGSAFVGLGNYLYLLQQGEFWSSLGRSLAFTFVAVWVQVLIGFIFALLLEHTKSAFRVFEVVVTIPIFLAPVVVGYLWKFILNVDFGFLGSLTKAIGLEPVSLLGSTQWALPTIIMVNTWQHTPFALLLFLAGLATLDKNTFEAARIDGASAVQTVIHITIPLLKRVIAVVVAVRTYSVFKVFEEIFVLTEGGPAGATSTLTYYLYKEGFVNFNTGVANALSVLMMIIILAIVFVYVRLIEE